MEKKKDTKKSINKKEKKTTNKTIKKPVKSSIKKTSGKKKKGFTLIELLAVIIILGILMIIAIPSVTKYISDSRKSAYIDTAKEIVAGTRNIVNEGKLGMYDTNTTYYIPAKYVNTENSLKSPYGEFTNTSAYVGVIYDGQGYKYYWISVDDAGQGIDEVTPLDKLDTDLIKSDLKTDEIFDKVKTTGIGERTNIKVLNLNGVWDDYSAVNNISEGGNSSTVGGDSGISTCPGCKYLYNPISYENGTFHYYYMKGNTAYESGEPATVVTEQLYDDYHDVIAQSGKNYFLGFVLNSNNEITHAYVCGIKNNTPFCIEGFSGQNPEIINSNYSIIRGMWNNECTDDSQRLICKTESPSFFSSASTYDEVEIGESTYPEEYEKICRVQNNGIAYCYDIPSAYFSD